MNKFTNPRAVAALALQQVLQRGRSLSAALPEYNSALSPADKALAQAICFGVVRHLPVYEWLTSQLMQKPLKKKVRVVHYVLLVGLYQLRTMRVPHHAAINETVQACTDVKQKALKGLVNAVLRNYQRQHDNLEHELAQNKDLALAFPGWLKRRLEQAWPEHSFAIMDASNQAAPMWLRVNQAQISTPEYMTKLQQAGIEAQTSISVSSALKLLTPVDVNLLPGFSDGLVSVQDLSAQRTAGLVNSAPGMNVLDACAAPGGKTAHLLEMTPDLQVTAIDSDEQRLGRIYDNLNRLRLNASVVAADASTPEVWWNNKPFDRILIDAPCSATGVIRRHPDIKWLRRDNDIDQLVEMQAMILKALWPLLKPGGRMVYATCSILPEENEEQIQHFLREQKDAKVIPLTESEALGWQLFPDPEQGDGFYYACIEKS